MFRWRQPGQKKLITFWGPKTVEWSVWAILSLLQPFELFVSLVSHTIYSEQSAKVQTSKSFHESSVKSARTGTFLAGNDERIESHSLNWNSVLCGIITLIVFVYFILCCFIIYLFQQINTVNFTALWKFCGNLQIHRRKFWKHGKVASLSWRCLICEYVLPWDYYWV